MSTQNQSNPEDAGQRRGVRIINEAVDQCQVQKTKYKNRRSEHPLPLKKYPQSKDHKQNLKELFETVDYTWGKLRWFAREELTEQYWENDDIKWPNIQFPADANTTGMEALDELPEEAAMRVETTVSTRHEQAQSTYQWIVLVPFKSQVKMINKFDEMRNELGFGPAAKKKAKRVEITEDMIEEVDEWRKQNLE